LICVFETRKIEHFQHFSIDATPWSRDLKHNCVCATTGVSRREPIFERRQTYAKRIVYHQIRANSERQRFEAKADSARI